MALRSRRLLLAFLLPAALALTIGAPAHAQSPPDQLLFGPQQHLRTSGAPNSYTDSFTVPASVGSPFLLHIVNGNPDGTNRISSATVTINNVQVAGPNDFNQNVAVVDRTVTLQPTNTLVVTVASPSGSYLTISVLGTKILPTPASLTPNPLTITVGATGTLTASLSPSPTASGTLSASSADTGVATVPASIAFASGQTQVPVPVTAVGEGSTGITVSLNGGSASSTVQVTPAPPTVTSLLPATLTITQGGSGTLTVTISAAQGTDTAVTLASSDPGVAFVPAQVTVPAGQTSASITVSANTPGTAQITASLNGSSATSLVTVTQALPTIVSLLPPTNPVTLGASTTLTVTISASQPTDTVVQVSASPAGIVTVPATVTVPAGQTSAPLLVGTVALGTAMVHVSLNGSMAESAVQVVPPAPALVAITTPVTVVIGATGTLTVTLNAAQLANTEVTLTVDNAGVLQVPASVTVPANQTQASFTVTGLQVGDAVVTGTVNGSTQSATVHVVPPPPTVVSLLPNPLAIQQGATGSFTLTINAAQLSDTVIPLTNSASAVAQVPTSVTVPAGQTSVTFPATGLTPGSATVTASINATSVSATVQVTPPPTVVTGLTPATVTAPKGTPAVLHVAVAPASADPQTVTLTSNNQTVATVPATVPIPAGALGADFPVMTVGVGSATVTATLNGGTASALVVVTPAELVTLTLSPQTPTLFVGQTQPFTATGTFTDGTTQDLTTSVTWTSSNQVVATITSSGVASALAVGTTTIKAASGSMTVETTLTVLTPPALGLTPATAALNVGDTLTLTVTSAEPADISGLTVTLTQSGTGSVTMPQTVLIPEGLTSATFSVTGVTAGTLTITATAPIRLPASSTITITNLVPVLSALSPNAVPSGSPALALTLIGDRFAPGATVQFGMLSLAATFVSPTQLSAVVPPSAIASRGTVAVTVVNPAPGGGPSNSLLFTIQNGPPLLTLIGNQTVGLGATLSFTVTATDPDNDPVAFAITPLPLPANASFNALTGQFVFTPDATQAGTFLLTFVASDGAASSVEAVTITVTGAPAGGITGVSGHVVDGSGAPLANISVTLTATGQSAVTNAQGVFTLTGLSVSGRQQLKVDGFAQGYAILVAPVDLIANVTTQLASNLTLPPIDTAHAVTINPGATTIVSNPNLPGVSVTIAAGTAKNPDGSLYTGSLSISPVPEYGRPESRPAELRPGLSITIQPAGVTLDPPAPITFPNVDNMAPGNDLDLWSLSPDTGTFSLVGAMRVSADGQRIETISGGVRKTAWHFPMGLGLGGGGLGGGQSGGCCGVKVSSQADLEEGALSLDQVVPGIRSLGVSRDLILHYRSTSADVRPIIPIDAFLSIRAAVPPTFSARLTVGGVQQGSEVYWNAAGLPENADSTSRLGVQFDASSLTTGRYRYEAMLFSNYSQSSIGSARRDQLLVRNERASPFGSGWTLAGLDRLVPLADGSVVLAQGTGETKLFPFLQSVSLVSWWPGDGTTQDVAGLNNGTLQGGAAFAPGRVGSAFSFDGVNDFVQVPHNPNLDPGIGSFSIDAWVKTTQGTGTQTVVSKYECGQFCPPGAASAYILSIADGRLQGWLRSSNSPPGFIVPFLSGTKFLVDGSFHHIVMVRDMNAGEFRLYVDGQLDASASLIPGSNNGPIQDGDGEPDPFLIGAKIVGGLTTRENFFTGLIDEVDFFAYALSAGEIQTLFAAGSNGQPKVPNTGTARFVSPLGDVSTLVKNTDGTYQRTMKDGTTYQFNAQGLQTAVTDRNGNQTAYAYNGQGSLTTMTDPAGQVTTFSYGGDKVSTITDPAGRVTQFEHEGQGNLTAITYADGSRETFVYDAQRRVTQRTDARNQTYQYTYDYTGRFTQATLPTGETRKLSPSQRIAVPNVAAGQGTQANPAPLAVPVNVASFTDALNHTTQFELDVLSRVTKQTDALNRVTNFQRDANGNPTQITRPNSAVTTMTYDTKGNLLTTTEQAIAATTTFTYEPVFNQVTSIKDPKNNTTTITYDVKGNPLTITDADNKVTTLTYDSRGLLLTSKDALNQTTTFTYDALGRLLTTTDPLNRTTTLTYDAAGNVATSTDALNRVTTFEYDAVNRLKKVTDPAGGITTYTYDGNGNLLTVKDAKNQTTTFTYDAKNRLASTTDPLGRVETYTYDGADNLASRLTPKGDTISFAYDAVNQLLSKTLPGSQVTSYTYDTVGNLTGVTDPDSALTMTYDLANRLLTTSTAGSSNQPSVSLSYTYDKNGNRLTVVDPTATNTYVYDALNRLTSLTSPAGATTYAFDALSRRTAVTLPNGTQTTYTYDPASQVQNILHQIISTSAQINKADYVYNTVGNRTSLTDKRGVQSFGYDNLDRLTSADHPLLATPQSFAYDAVGNRTTGGAVVNAGNQLTADANFTYQYDDNGNLTRKTILATGNFTAYMYDAENRLIQVDEFAAGSSTPGATSTYRYDGLGRRIEKIGNGLTRRYVYDGEDILLEYDGTNALQSRYTHGPGIDEPVAMTRGGSTFFYHQDGLGTVTELTDSSGATAQSYAYDAYGNIIQQTGSVENPYTYTGREFDAETGLYYYRARHYDPRLGRFLQKDPSLFPSSRLRPSASQSFGLLRARPAELHAYAYVNNNPVNFTDPSGLEPDICPLCPRTDPKCTVVCFGVALGTGSLFYCFEIPCTSIRPLGFFVIDAGRTFIVRCDVWDKMNKGPGI